MTRNIAYALIAFSALCWIGAAWVGISNSGAGASPDSINVLNMFTGIASTSALLAIALGIWFKD